MPLGETRSATRALKMAEGRSEASEKSDNLSSDSEKESPLKEPHAELKKSGTSNSSGKPSIKDQAAQITRNKASKEIKEPVSKDADNVDTEAIEEIAPETGSSEISDEKDGGEDQNKPPNESRTRSSSRSKADKEPKASSSSRSRSSKGGGKRREDPADVLSPILKAQDRTFSSSRGGGTRRSSKSPPRKKSKSDSETKSSHRSSGSKTVEKPDYSKELLGAIKELNTSLNTNYGGIRKDVVELASSFQQSFSQLAKKVSSPREPSSDEESSDYSSSEDESGDDTQGKVCDHPISEEDEPPLSLFLPNLRQRRGLLAGLSRLQLRNR